MQRIESLGSHACLVCPLLLFLGGVALTEARGQDGMPPGPTRFAPRTLVAGVRIVGYETTKEQFIQSQLKTRKDREFDPQVVQADVRRLASTGRFRTVKTYTQETPDGVLVTFEVVENPTIRYVRYLGNRNISDRSLDKQDGLEVGDSVNPYAIDEARRKIEEFYHSKGFPKTQVSVLEGDKPQDQGAVFVINEGQLERIASVNFVGNTIATDARLKTQIKSKPGFLWVLFGGKVDRKQMDEDIERLTSYYRSLGFFNARIGRELEFNDAGTWLSLRFVIDEGPRYVVRNLNVMGNEKFSSQDLLGKAELHSGDYFNQAKMNRDVRTLLDEYGSQGHIFADVQADPRFLDEPGELDLVYKIKEGGVWRAGEIDIHIEGEHPHTRESVVLNRVSVRPGDIIDIREVRASERRLKYSQLFQNDPATGTSPQVVVRPPELQESVENVAEGNPPRSSSYRGQSPDGWWSEAAGWGDGVLGWWTDEVLGWWSDGAE
jgi:outer membrane protein insertion porin family